MSGHCEFCGIWHSASCCHPGRGALDVADHEITALRAKLAEAEKAREEAEAKLVGIRMLHAENGETRAIFVGEGVKVLAECIVDFYREHGAKNHVEISAVDKITGERFALTVQRIDGKTPAEMRHEAEQARDAALAREAKMREFVRSIADECCDCNHDDCKHDMARALAGGGEEGK